MQNEPNGYGKARFGMSVDEVRAVYPNLEELHRDLGAAVVSGPLVARFVLWKQDVPGLPKPTDVELRFWKGKLWLAIVFFGENDLETVTKSLAEQHGPTAGGGQGTVWRGAKSTIVVAAKARWYSMQDNGLSQEAQKVFMEDLKRSLQRSQEKPVDTPAATPPAAPPSAPAEK